MDLLLLLLLTSNLPARPSAEDAPARPLPDAANDDSERDARERPRERRSLRTPQG
jgi:hypothetical protein